MRKRCLPCERELVSRRDEAFTEVKERHYESVGYSQLINIFLFHPNSESGKRPWLYFSLISVSPPLYLHIVLMSQTSFISSAPETVLCFQPYPILPSEHEQCWMARLMSGPKRVCKAISLHDCDAGWSIAWLFCQVSALICNFVQHGGHLNVSSVPAGRHLRSVRLGCCCRHLSLLLQVQPPAKISSSSCIALLCLNRKKQVVRFRAVL